MQITVYVHVETEDNIRCEITSFGGESDPYAAIYFWDTTIMTPSSRDETLQILTRLRDEVAAAIAKLDVGRP